MLHLGATKARNQVNVLKKVKIEGQWELCPVVVEPDGKLKDRVQVNGSSEVHREGGLLCSPRSRASYARRRGRLAETPGLLRELAELNKERNLQQAREVDEP